MSDRYSLLDRVLGLCTVVLLSSTCLAENLLINSDFSRGTAPGDKDVGWKLKLAKGQKSECTIVQGPQAGTHAIRIYNDELGTSFISQEFAVRPGRWYVAEVWVKSEGMYAFDFAPKIELRGGRRVSGWRFHDGTFAWPKPGWRIIRAIDYSAGAERLKLSLGGGGHAGGWSGELLFSQPVVRECSQVEAAGYYPYPSNRHPVLYGPAVDAAKGRYGHAFQRGNVCRVARNFPNPFDVISRMDAKAPDGRISLVLPPGVRFRKVQSRKITPKISDLPDGRQHVELPPGACEMVVDSDLSPGERATGYVSCEWKGGYQLPFPVVFEGVQIPKVAAPKRAMATLGVGGWTHTLWENSKSSLTTQDAMIRDVTRLGFNGVEIWGGNATHYAKQGLHGATAFGGTFYVDVKKYPESLARKLDGTPCMDRKGLMCPSYRGPGLEAYTNRVRGYGALASALTLDDEFYACSGESPIICFCDRCMKRWTQWAVKEAPGLKGIGPRVFAKRPHKYPKHYNAWLRFRCDLIAERYALLRKAFREAVKKAGTKTTPRPMLGAYVGGGPLVGIHSNESLIGALDYLANMVYLDGDGIRRRVAELAPRSGGKLVIAISPGYQMSPPGDARCQVLEAVMGGSKGFIAWGYYMGMMTGHLVDMAEAIKMFAPVEDVILDGEIEGGYTADTDTVNLLARKRGAESVLLVSDYSPNPGRVSVNVPGKAELAVTDLFTNDIVAHLDAGKRTFPVTLRRRFRARLYYLKPAGKP